MLSSASRLLVLFLFVLVGVLSPRLHAARVSITATYAGSSNRIYALVVDGNGGTRQYFGNLDVATNQTEPIDLPAGGGYRFRILVGTQGIGTYVSSGKALNVTVAEEGVNAVNITCTAPTVRRVAAPTGSLPAGSRFTLAYEITDASEYFADATQVLLWGGSTDDSAGGYVREIRRYETTIARGRIERLDTDVYRVTYDNVPGTPVADQASYILGVVSPAFLRTTAGPIVATGSFLYQDFVQKIEFSAPVQGVTLDDGTARTMVAVVDGEGFIVRALGFSPLKIGLPPGTRYRIRYYSWNDNGRFSTGREENVTVSAGAFTDVSASYEPWSMVPSPANPTQVAAGQNYTLKFTMTDAGRIFERTGDLQMVSVKDLPAGQIPGGVSATASIDVLDAVRSEVTFAMQAPSLPGSAQLQVAGFPRLSWGSLGFSYYAAYSPDRELGDAPLPMEFTAIETGLAITMDGILDSADTVVVAIDGPRFHTIQAVRVVDGVAQITLGLPAGNGYRLRAASQSTNTSRGILRSIGAVASVDVSAGGIRPVTLKLVKPQVSLSDEISPGSVPYNRPRVALGESYGLKYTITVPEGFFSAPFPTFELGRLVNDTNGTTFLPTKQVVGTDSIALTYELTPPVASASAVLTHVILLELGTFSIPGSSIIPRYDFLDHQNPLGKVDLIVPGAAPVATDYPLGGGTVQAGSWHSFFFPFSGAPYPSYEWRKNGVPLVNPNVVTTAEGASMHILGVEESDTGEYTVVATNAFGSATSPAVKLVVLPAVPPAPPPPPPPVPSRLVNLSVRARSGQGDETLIVGFVVGGAGTSGQKSLLIRGMGPTLVRHDVSGFLANPQLTLFDRQDALLANDDWGGSATMVELARQLGASSFIDNTSTDAALAMSNFEARPYTVHVSGVGRTTGEALAEIYDADTAATATTPRLMNLSARVHLKVVGETLIGGFVIGGSAPKKVLIRAIGPGLEPHQVTEFMVDPKLTLYEDARPIGVNDNWSAAEMGDIFGRVGASPIATGSKDAAMIATLAPRPYTVHVQSATGSTGIVLIEVYDAD